MNKERILQKIKAAAKANGGSPLGIDRFENETGIKEWDWQKHWPRWSDAVREAGFTPNKLTVSYSETELLNKYAVLTKELGKLPTHGDLLFKTHNDSSFPTEKTFRRFGGKALLIKQLAEFCKTRSEHKIVADLCAAYVIPKRSKVEETVYQVEEFGFVYLIKSGRYFKIGKTNSAGRREYELAIQLPEKTTTVHVIQTDDPGGIEAYWHNRFAAKRKNGEWFDLSPKDIAAFKRRKLFM